MSQNLICADFMNRSLTLELIHTALDFDPSVSSFDDTDEWMNLVQAPLLCFSIYCTFPTAGLNCGRLVLCATLPG